MSMLPTEPEISVKVFISYAHADQELHKKLGEHLSALKRSGKITIWQDQEIPLGADWEHQINIRLNEADLILLLVSSSFLASNYCWNKEVETALERHKVGKAKVIPIILKPVYWQDTPLGHLQALPTEAKPVTQWGDPDAAWENIVQGIRGIVESKLSQLQEDALRNKKINLLVGKIQQDLIPALTNIYKELDNLELRFKEYDEKKREIEENLSKNLLLGQKVREKYETAENEQSLLLKRFEELNEQISGEAEGRKTPPYA